MAAAEKEDVSKFNDELLKKEPTDTEPRRNSKSAIIQRILQIAEENDLELTYSNTKLKRMSKERLQRMLAEILQEAVKNQMAAQVNAPSGNDKVIALATLRMMHDMAANGIEATLNNVLPRYGYKVDGFTHKMKHPSTSKVIDQCLEEIAAESEILQYIESPYSRLALCWSSCMLTSVRRAPRNNLNSFSKQHAANMGPRPSGQKDSFRPGPDRGAPAREVDSGSRPPEQNVRTV